VQWEGARPPVNSTGASGICIEVEPSSDSASNVAIGGYPTWPRGEMDAGLAGNRHVEGEAGLRSPDAGGVTNLDARPDRGMDNESATLRRVGVEARKPKPDLWDRAFGGFGPSRRGRSGRALSRWLPHAHATSQVRLLMPHANLERGLGSRIIGYVQPGLSTAVKEIVRLKGVP
jgi:hypothetical protein